MLFRSIDSRETVKKCNAATDRIAVGKRCGGDIGVGFGINTSSEIKRSVSAALDSRGKGTEDGFAACDAGIVVVSALDFHFRRMGDGILHAVAEGKGGSCAMGGAETEEEKDSILL